MLMLFLYLFIGIIYNKYLGHLLVYHQFMYSLINLFHIGLLSFPGKHQALSCLSFWPWFSHSLEFSPSLSPLACTWLAPFHPLVSSCSWAETWKRDSYPTQTLLLSVKPPCLPFPCFCSFSCLPYIFSRVYSRYVGPNPVGTSQLTELSGWFF